jgi:chromate transport protein ChrA
MPVTASASFWVSTLILGLISAVPGLIIGAILRRWRMVQSRSLWLVIGNVATLFIGRFMLPDVPAIYLVILITVLGPLGLYRNDLWTYWTKGEFPPDAE